MFLPCLGQVTRSTESPTRSGSGRWSRIQAENKVKTRINFRPCGHRLGSTNEGGRTLWTYSTNLYPNNLDKKSGLMWDLKDIFIGLIGVAIVQELTVWTLDSKQEKHSTQRVVLYYKWVSEQECCSRQEIRIWAIWAAVAMQSTGCFTVYYEIIIVSITSGA